MASNKNIFCVSNPTKILDGLWQVMSESGISIENMLIFLPSRRAVRSAEKMIAERMGGAAIMPHLVPLGDGFDDEDDNLVNDTVSTLERVVVASYLLSHIPSVRTISSAIPIARSLITMQDYLENSMVDIDKINWMDLVDEKYAQHFRDKAEIFNILSTVNSVIFDGRVTAVRARNADVLKWCDFIKTMPADSLVVVCGSTASVPATRELMRVVASVPNGRIILSGKISGAVDDFKLDTNPYNSEYKFLSELGLGLNDVRVLDVGVSHIDFMNRAFGNVSNKEKKYDLQNCHLIECDGEAEEAAVVAKIASESVADGKSVLVITPDAAGNQRLISEFERCGINADFSGGQKASSTRAGRAILNLLDDWIETKSEAFHAYYVKNNFNLFDTIAEIIDVFKGQLLPVFDVSDDANMPIWIEIKKLSDYIAQQKIQLTLQDARAFIADTLSSVRIRPKKTDDANVIVLGTIESRMQVADVVILMGLNEGMFPARGYENPWLPRPLAESVGVPSPDHKVSLMALDFMNHACGAEVYWLRSTVSGGVQTQESRFISRVLVAGGVFDSARGTQILKSIRDENNIQSQPLDYSAPTPPADWSDVYVTELELLIHNPYAFYVRHILRLNPEKDYWEPVDARDFGMLVHDALEHASDDMSMDDLVKQMDARAIQILGQNNLLWHFWHRRFVQIAPIALYMLKKTPDAYVEIPGIVEICGRNVRARADRVWDGGVLDIKTGAAPTKNKLLAGTMPQLPLEALMLQSGGFAIKTSEKSSLPKIVFLQLKSGDTKLIEFNDADTKNMINSAKLKVTELFNMYSAGGAPYEYYKTGDVKYSAYDDFSRIDERD